MKKIVIAMLLILPLIIVATVLVATNIISNEAYIAVENVVLNVKSDETIVVPLSQNEFQLQATVYPTSAKNKNVRWKIENVQCFGDEIASPVTISDNGLLQLNTYCTFDVVVTTVEASKRARANFYVKCDKLEGVTIEANDTIKVGEKEMLKAVFNPLDAEAENAVWTSSNNNIISVDGNGIITAKSTGSAIITVVVDGHTATKTITVSKGITNFGNNFAISQNSFPVSLLGANGTVTVISGANIEAGIFTFTDDTATIMVGETIVVINKCEDDDIVFENASFIEGKLLAVGKLPTYLNVVYKNVFAKEKPSVTLSSSDKNIASVDSFGQVTALSKGNVTITASGSQIISLDFLAVKPVNFIRLSKVDGDDKRGIAEETIYGTKVYSGGSLVNYELPLLIQYPVAADWEDYEITVNNTIASVVGNKVIITGDVATMTTLMITVKAKYSAYESMEVRTKRNIQIINGVNCYNYGDMERASQDNMAIMMHNNVEYEKNKSTITLKNDFYGNGYLIDATKSSKNKDTPMFLIKSDGVKVSNTQLRGDDIENINRANGLSGYVLVIGEIEQERFSNITIEYSIIENGYFGMDMHNSDVYVNGCIIRNTSNFGISLPSNLKEDGSCDYSNLTMNNCVMSNIVATAVGISTNSKPMELQSNFYSTGFLDIYNWQDVTSMRMLDRELVPGNDSMNTALKNLVSTALKNEIKKSKYDHIRLTVNDVNYLHLGIVTAGAINPNTSIVEIEDERFIKLPLDVLDTFRLDPCVLYIYDNTSNIKADTSYEESEELYNRLRGDK